MTSNRPVTVIAILSVMLLAACGGTSHSASPDEGRASASPVASGGASLTAGIPAFTDVPAYRVDAAGAVVEPGPAPAGTPDLAWKVEIGKTHWSPILAGGLLVVGNAAGDVIALDGRTGAERWRFHAAEGLATDSLNGSAATADGLVFVSDPATVYALDAATGSQRWATPVPTQGSRPIPSGGVVYVGSIGGAVGLDEATGAVAWRWVGPPGVAMTMGAISDGVAHVSSRTDGRVYAVDLGDGSLRWDYQTVSLAVGSSEVVGDTLYVGTNEAGATAPVGVVYAIDRATGNPRWRYSSPSGRQLVPGPVRDRVVFLSSEVDGIYAMRDDPGTATLVWHTSTPPTWFPLSIVGDTLYEQRNDGSIGAYAVADGRLIWETPATPDTGGGPPLVSGGMIFAVGDGGRVSAYADPALIAELPTAMPPPIATPSPTPNPLPDPFAVVRSFSWTSTKLAIPLGMDAGPDGLLYVLDTKPSVTVIDPADGHVVRAWGSQGAGRGQFDLTRPDDNPGFGDITIAPDGRVYVADGSNHRVQVFQPDGTYIDQFGSFGTGEGRFGSIAEVVAGRDGSIYVLDESANRISKFSADGKFLWQSPGSGADPELADPLHGLAVRAMGRSS